jgi:hypothetical protein
MIDTQFFYTVIAIIVAVAATGTFIVVLAGFFQGFKSDIGGSSE